MSLILKSNQKATVKLPNVSTLNTTAELEYVKYSKRVTDDGGRIVDPEKTLKSFQSLFHWGFYGNVNSWVSGSFGVKTDPQGGILKLYAIDGYDVVGKTYGSGVLPKLLENGSIDFTSNTKGDTVNGALLTTEQPVRVSRNNDLSLGATMDYSGSDPINFYRDSALMAVSTHGVTAFGHTGVIARVWLGAPTKAGLSSTYFNTAKHPLTIGSNNHNVGLVMGNADATFSFHLTPNNEAYSTGYKAYYLNTKYPYDGGYEDLVQPITNISDYELYLDFGGEDRGDGGKSFFYGKAKEFFSLSVVETNPDGSPLAIDRMANLNF